jgi:hypothetical protein
MSDQPLLVMSVYCPGSEKWLNIQKQALDKTTQNYIHAIYLNNLDTLEHTHSNCIIVGKTTTNKWSSIQHCEGLNNLIEYAKSGNYRAWLFLDSDAFPINKNWESILNNKNAAIVRTDNLDTFFHPCVAYCTDKNIRFEISSTKNLLGNIIKDTTVHGNFFPLVRTNKKNIDPLRYGVYYDLFYHHCAGSRQFSTRSGSYYKNNAKNFEQYEKLFFYSPDDFISELVGDIHN